LIISYVLENLGKGVPEKSVYMMTISRNRQQLLETLVLLQIDPTGRLTKSVHPPQNLGALPPAMQTMIRQQQQKRMRELAKQQLEQQLRDQEQRRKLLDRLVRDLWQESTEVLQQRLHDDNATIRWIATQVVGTKRIRLESDLIERLSDANLEVREAARQALVRIGRGTDFGPALQATPTQRAQAVEKWRSWLALQDAPGQGQSLQPGTATDAKVTETIPLLTVDAEAVRLSKKLIEASPGEQAEMLRDLLIGKGATYTQALATAIPQLSGDLRAKARDALAERLTRMTAATLRDKLKDDNGEIRRAAALACAMKEDRSHIPDLITLLSDAEPPVSRAARAALRELSGQDFGPDTNASKAERAQAVAAWKAWWAKQQRDK